MRYLAILLMIVVMSMLVVAEEQDVSMRFKQNEVVNYHFKCLNDSNDYCESGTLLLISVEYPDGENALDNISMTYNPTYFNVTLPTSVIGDKYNALIVSPTGNASSEFRYEVTPTGFIGTLGLYLVFLTVLGSIIILGFRINEAWFVVIGGMGLIMLGIYSINYGIVGFKDMFMTWGIGLFEIGIGAILSIGAAWQKLDYD